LLARPHIPQTRWSPLFYVDGVIVAAIALSLLCQLAVTAAAMNRPAILWNGAATGLLVVTLAWAGVVYLGKRTHGATASDPYAYAQMGLIWPSAEHFYIVSHFFSKLFRFTSPGLPCSRSGTTSHETSWATAPACGPQAHPCCWPGATCCWRVRPVCHNSDCRPGSADRDLGPRAGGAFQGAQASSSPERRIGSWPLGQFPGKMWIDFWCPWPMHLPNYYGSWTLVRLQGHAPTFGLRNRAFLFFLSGLCLWLGILVRHISWSWPCPWRLRRAVLPST